MTSAVVGILVGGASRRMGGRAKGLLAAPGTDEPVLTRLVRLSRELDLETVLVGDASPYSALALDVPRLPDAPPGVGPIGGLAALLRHARERPAIALSCDLPYLTRATLELLATHASTAAVLAGRRGLDAPWEPLIARYQPATVLPELEKRLAERRHSLQDLLARVTMEELPLPSTEQRSLIDWDEPGDMESPPH